MAMLTYDDRPRIAVAFEAPTKPVAPAVEAPVEPDDDVQERWLQAQPWPRRWFARFYRALRKLQPAFPPMSCC
ncbi:hypothetical protein DNX69_14770 [Rhodopseudomonas palustris]|uniref:Uncharacterized protein n=1 Tax=Rhodopseudomonas palustris TaxID=1076 RepID=A0A323USV9_RHOPL|nr:hypothetical protein [Rhodopseudomonas palustris]PZA10618.1 hypothetical protein DNX69_14770 [Rhodopseudomonas palustris]